MAEGAALGSPGLGHAATYKELTSLARHPVLSATRAYTTVIKPFHSKATHAAAISSNPRREGSREAFASAETLEAIIGTRSLLLAPRPRASTISV